MRTSTDTKNASITLKETKGQYAQLNGEDEKYYKQLEHTGVSEAETEQEEQSQRAKSPRMAVSVNPNDMQEVTELFDKIRKNRLELNSDKVITS